MALFKISKGASGGLSNQALGDGYCWFTYDDGKFYIDYKDPTDNIVKRKALNADNADHDHLGNLINSSYAANLTFDNSTYVLTLLAKSGATLATINLIDYELTGALNGNTYTYTLTPFQNGTALTSAATSATIPSMSAATGSTAGAAGLVPAPQAGAQDKFLRGDGTWVDLFSEYDAMVFKGVLDSTGNTPGSQLTVPAKDYSAGWTYRVAHASTYAGEYCEKGDLLIAIKDGPTSGTNVIDEDWAKIEHNIDGALFMHHDGFELSDGTKLLNVTGGGVVTTSSSTVGSFTKPVFLNAGTLTETTHSLNATINSGTANRMAYYSEANTIAAATNHYTSNNKLGINYTSEPTDSNLYVNGVSKFYGDTWVINTNGGSTQRFYIAKDNTINNSMSTWLDNNYTHFDIQNSGTGSNIDFKLHATDDANNGTGTNTSHVYFYGSDGESKIAADRGYFDLTANIGGVNENYNLYVNGNAKIESSPVADTPLVTFISNTTPSTGGYQHGLHYLVPNMVENSNAAIYFGKAASTGDSACLQMNWAGNNNNNNFLGLGFYSVNNLVRIYRNGSLSIGAANNNYKLYVNGTGYISSNLTVDGSIYFGANSSGTGGKPVLAYNSNNTAFGITYYEGTPDVMTFSASGNANNKVNADFSINGLGDGILSNRGKRIPHTGNNTGNVGSATQPVYINAGVISNTDYALGATVNSGTANRITYYSGNNAISAGNIATDGSYLDPVTPDTGHLGSATALWNTIYTKMLSTRTIDAAPTTINSDSALYIGYGAIQPTKATKIYYSANTSSRTEFFEVNNNGAYALTRFGVNGQNTSYTLYVNGAQDTSYALYVKGNAYITGNTIVGNEAGGLSRTQTEKAHHIVSPGGGSYTTGTSSITGALKIRLPVSWTNAMMNFEVDIYNYNTTSVSTYHISGYNYTVSTKWQNIAAYSNGVGNKSNLTVRFGHDGTYCCVLIGEVDTVWSYPQITVRDVYLGYSTQNIATWSKGWELSFVTTLPTISANAVIENPNKTRDGTANKIAWYPTTLSVASSNITTDSTNITMPTASLITTGHNASHTGLKLGDAYITAIAGQVIFQNNTSIRFGSDTWEYRYWAGLKYDSSNKIIYLGLADGTIFTTNGNNNMSGGTLALPGVRYLSINGKIAIDANDAWLRINEGKAFASGIYCGANVVRTDNVFQVGNNGSSFYANSSGNGYFSNTLGIAGTNTSYKLYVNGTSLFTNAVRIQYNTPNLYLRDTNTAADTYAIMRFGNSSNENAAYIFLNGPSRTNDGGANVMTIRNNVGYLRLNNTVHIGAENKKGGLRIYGNFNHAATGETYDSNDRPSLTMSGSYPQIFLIANANNANHGASLTFAGMDTANATSGNFKAFSFGTPSTGCTFLSLGYGTNNNPHYNGLAGNTNGFEIMRWNSNGQTVLKANPANDTYCLSIESQAAASTIGTGYQHGIHYLLPNMGTNAHAAALIFGKARNAGNAGCIEFVYSGTSNGDTNCVGIGFWSKNNIVRVYNNQCVTIGNSTATGSLGLANTSNTTGNGISLYGGAAVGMPQYGMAFAGSGTFGTFGGCTESWQTYFTTSNTANRGWIFKRYVGTDANTKKGYNSASIRATDGVYFGGGVSLYHPDKNAWCGDFYINRIGTANSGDNNATRGTQGITLLRVGNNIAWPAAGTAGGDNNSTGIVRIYAENTYFTDIMSQAGSANRTFYLPNYNAVMYAVHAGNNNAVGSATQPVYVAANGRVTACTAYASASVDTAKYLLTAAHGSVPNPTYGVNRLEYFNTSLAAGAAANTTGSPTQDWYYHLRMNHANSSGYYVDIAACFHNDNIYWKRVSGGSVSNNKWMHIWVEGNAVTSAVWNDYAEYRETDAIEAGRCVTENGDDSMTITTKRLQKGCSITSDTWGFAQGETEKAKTPIAVSGRVLAYPYESREDFKNHIGDAVCSGPDGTVSIMTDEEVLKYPLTIIGTISSVPDYEEWGGGTEVDRGPVKVNGRVWIRIR